MNCKPLFLIVLLGACAHGAHIERVFFPFDKGVLCDEWSRIEVERRFQLAQDACRSAWLTFSECERFDPSIKSIKMLDAKVGYEALILNCGGSAYELAVANDVYRFVWRPSDPDGDLSIWTGAWDGCFGTPPERIARGDVLEDH